MAAVRRPEKALLAHSTVVVVRRVARRVGRSVGLSITRYPAPNTLAWLTRQVFERLGINCVLDVGAYRGEYVDFLRRELAFAGQVLSFEPAAASHRELTKRWANDPRWRGLPFGLGSQPGTASLNVFGAGNFNSLLPAGEYGSHRFTPLAAAAATEAVELRRLDEVLPELLEHMPSPHVFLKIDAQGSDLDVVQGAAGVLPAIEAMQLELSVRPCYAGQPALPQAITALAELHYELLGVFPVARDGLRVVEFDGLFCRSA